MAYYEAIAYSQDSSTTYLKNNPKGPKDNHSILSTEQQLCNIHECRLQATGCRLQAVGYRLHKQCSWQRIVRLLKSWQATGCRLQAAGYRLQAAGYRLQAGDGSSIQNTLSEILGRRPTGYRLQAAGYRLQAAG